MAGFRPAGSCRANVVLVAVPLRLVKLAVPLTTVLSAALAGKPAKLALMSATGVKAVAAVAVLFAGVVSAVVLLTWPLNVCTVVLAAGTL